MGTQKIYGLFVDDELFYVGFTSRDLESRLKEHIYTSLNPTDRQLINEGIRGEVDPKRKVIITAIDEGFELTIKLLHECPSHEEVDENYYIEMYRNRGHYLTNRATGSVFQKTALVNGKQVATSKNGTSLKEVQMRKAWDGSKRQLRMTPKMWSEFINKQYKHHLSLHRLAPDLVPLETYEDIEDRFKPLYVPIYPDSP